MKWFIEVTRVDGNTNATFEKSININNIIDFEDSYIMTSRVLSCYHSGTSYTECVKVKESYEQIKKLIQEAQ